MALLPRCAGDDWLQVVPVVVIAFVQSPFSGLYIAGGWLLPGRKRVVPYSIQMAQTAEDRHCFDRI